MSENNTAPRITLVHALSESVAPIHESFARLWPEAVITDLLDNSLSKDLASVGQLNTAIMNRFLTLGRYGAQAEGIGGKTQALLFTCSAFGPAIDAVKGDLTIPVLRPNEAAFAEALALGSRLALVVTFAPSLPALSAELHEMAQARGQEITIVPILADGALAALQSGDGEGHDAAVLKACTDLAEVDAVMLGQFSLARAAGPLRKQVSCPVVTTPDSAVRALRGLLSA